MNRTRRAAKRAQANHHRTAQAERKTTALTEATAASKRAKKGVKGIAAQMLKRGYTPDHRGGWKRLPQPTTGDISHG